MRAIALNRLPFTEHYVMDASRHLWMNVVIKLLVPVHTEGSECMIEPTVKSSPAVTGSKYDQYCGELISARYRLPSSLNLFQACSSSLGSCAPLPCSCHKRLPCGTEHGHYAMSTKSLGYFCSVAVR